MTTEDLRNPTFRWCAAGFLGAWHGLAPSRRLKDVFGAGLPAFIKT
jgi:hypothetical protein